MKKVIDGIMGHATADALGVAVEFKTRDFLTGHPISEMLDSYVEAGAWSDDTSMEICLMDSYIHNHCFDYNDIMNRFVRWVEKGEYSSLNYCFDIGITCREALVRYENGEEALKCGGDSFYDNGNGSLMRILPLAYYAYYKNINDEELYLLTKNISSLTHRHNIAILGCYIYLKYILFLLNGYEKREAYYLLKQFDFAQIDQESAGYYKRILKDDIQLLKINDIKSGGYVVDSLEASLWSFLNSLTYKEAVCKAVNLGDDTDTIGAITGSMAAVAYGYKAIPQEWLNKLLKRDYLEELSAKYEQALLD